MGYDFSFQTTLQKGSTIDFVVSPKGADCYDGTTFTATITAVPEPTTALAGLLSLGLLGFGLCGPFRAKEPS